MKTLAAWGKLIVALFRHRSLKTLLFSPPGHFYSPLPDLKQVEADGGRIFADAETVPGIDLNETHQRELLRSFSAFAADLPFTDEPADGLRYYYRNPFFGYGDAIILHSFLRHFKPARVIEIGSGFSSAVMLDTRQLYLDDQTRFTFIEPFSERLQSLFTGQDAQTCRLIEMSVQDVPLDTYDALEKDDILFIDSSHVVKCGSDLEHIFFKVLPRLKPGVIVHFHDIHWPFQYPREWISGGRAWNEVYFLRAFLHNNRQVAVEYFNSHMATRHEEDVRKSLPLCLNNPGGGFWMRILDGVSVERNS
jgi:predicted O-methyltransferase YrrM